MTLVRHGDFELTLCYVDTLLESKHDLIQKAVGWLLREVGKRNPPRISEPNFDIIRISFKESLAELFGKGDGVRMKLLKKTIWQMN